MKSDQVSATALMSAFIRYYHSQFDSPKIFDDYLAYHTLTDEEREGMSNHLANAIPFFAPEQATSTMDAKTALQIVMRAMSASIVLSRARYAEDCLEQAILKEGVQQYVILGAGMDTFAFRRHDLLEQINVFEVDHPATQCIKLERLKQKGWQHLPKLHFIPLDFTKDNLASELQHSAYDPKKQSFFSWLGVSYYLEKDQVYQNLGLMAEIAPIGSRIVFDYQDDEALNPEKAAERTKKMQQLAKAAGEPMKSGFDPLVLTKDLRALGLSLVENLSPPDIQRRYFNSLNNGYYAFEHVHFAQAVVQ